MSVSGHSSVLDINSIRRKKPRVSRKGRKNLTFKDKVELIATIERNLNNLHEHDWQIVSELFNSQAERDHRPFRTATSVRSAFNKLRNRKRPTGDAPLDDLIDRANKLHRALYRKSRVGVNSSAASEDEDEDVTSTSMSTSNQGAPFTRQTPTEDHGSLSTHNSLVGSISRDSPVNKRARTSTMILGQSNQSNRTGQEHTSPSIMGHGGNAQYNSNMMPQSSKEFIVSIPDPQHQSTPQRNAAPQRNTGNPGNNSGIFSSTSGRSLSPVHRNLGATPYGSFPVPVPVSNTNQQGNGQQDARSGKPRASEIPILMHSRTGLPVTSMGTSDLLNQSSTPIQQPVFLNDGSVMQDNNFELIALRRENNNYREECFNLKSKELEFKNEMYNARKLHDKEIARKDSIIAEKDARIERLLASISGSGKNGDDADRIRLLKDTIEEKNRKYAALQAEVDFLNQKLKFSNVALEQQKTLHEMEIKRYKMASELHHSNGSND